MIRLMKINIIFGFTLISVIFLSCASVINFTEPGGPQYYGHYASVESSDSIDIKIISYNIAWSANVDEAITEMKHYEELENADLILLQEMALDGVEKMARELNYNYIYCPGSIHYVHESDIGNAILSKWPLSEGEKVIFPHKQSWNDRIRTATVATAKVKGHSIRVYNVHTATVLMSERKQLDQLACVLEDVHDSDEMIIVGGDFNTARPGSVDKVHQLFLNAGFFYATRDAGYTVKAFGIVPFTLDHIYTRGLNVVDCGTVSQAKASDHFPLWASVRL